jgi:tRNA-dihydrouridine synthase 2
MRKGEKAIPERMKEIVDLVKSMNVGVAVLANGDCLSVDDANRLREITGADGAMIATAAESNPSCFRSETNGGLAVADTTIIPDFLRLVRPLPHLQPQY